MTRDMKKPILDESYNRCGSFTITWTAAAATRYPAIPDTFISLSTIAGPVDFFLVRNKTAQTIRIAFDQDAGASSGLPLAAGEDYEIPVRAVNYISIYCPAVDATGVQVHWFGW